MRHSAYLNAVPDAPKSVQSTAPRLSRLEARRKEWVDAGKGKADDFRSDMPPLDGAAYLIEYLWEVGPVMPGAMSAAPVTHEELRAWAELTGIELRPWEARFVRRLSRDYAAEGQRAVTLGCEPPWKMPSAKPEPSAVQLSLRELAKE